MDEMRALLDSLMGADRNEPVKNRKTFKDSDVCHFFVLDFCPHDLFPNTKSDLGPCPNKHSDFFKSEFATDPDHDYYQWKYEEEFIDKLQRLINAVEIRIKRGNDRILGHDDQQIEKGREKKLDDMRAEVSAILKLAEEAGETGNIAEAEAQTAKANELRRKIDSISVTPVMPISAQERSLRVCDICSAMQSTGDAASRFESHVNGKQHKGYELIRSTLAKLREKHAAGKPSHMRPSDSFRSKDERPVQNGDAADAPNSETQRRGSTERSYSRDRTHRVSSHGSRGYVDHVDYDRRRHYGRSDSHRIRDDSDRRSDRRRHNDSRHRPSRSKERRHSYDSDIDNRRPKKHRSTDETSGGRKSDAPKIIEKENDPRHKGSDISSDAVTLNS